MTCDEAQALLGDALDGAEIDPDRESAAAEHLDACASCARAARELSSVHRLILESSVAETLPVGAPVAKPRSLPRRRPTRPAPRSSNLVPALVAAGLLIGVGGWFLLHRADPIDHPRVPGLQPPIDTSGLGTLEYPGGAKHPFHAGEAVHGPVVLAWRDGTRMTLADHGSIDRVEDNDGGKLVLFTRGTLTADVMPQPSGRPLRFATPHGEARVLGTVLRLKVGMDPKEGTRLDVDRGTVELRNNGGRSVLVESGFYAVSAAGVDLVARKTEPPGWKNVTNDVGGAVWGRGGVTLLAAVPDRDEILAGVSNEWMWSSSDGGATWKRLGSAGGEPIRNMPHQLLFDPVNPRTFWITGIYGPGLFKTTDGGASFRRLGSLNHLDGLAVDFSDPARRTLLVTKHLDAGGLQLSPDGGESWQSIGDRLPTATSSSSAAFILDSKTFLVDAFGAFNSTEGIYRTTDAGTTWTRVSTILPAGPPLLASDGALYWQAKAGFADGILKSVDRGLTWSLMKGPVKTTPVETSDGTLVGVFEQQMFSSSNGGAGWQKLGEPIPIKPVRTFTGMTYEAAVYSPPRRALYVWRNTETRSAEAIFRWQFPE
jgi:ferric-dicitrate binding protein FerR (iron transport regulator)